MEGIVPLVGGLRIDRSVEDTHRMWPALPG